MSKRETLIIWLFVLSLLGQSVAYAGISCLDIGMQDMAMAVDDPDTGLDGCCQTDSGCSLLVCTTVVFLFNTMLEVDPTLVSALINLSPAVFTSISGIPVYHPPIVYLITA